METNEICIVIRMAQVQDVAIDFEVIVVIDGIEAIDILTMKWMIDAIQ